MNINHRGSKLRPKPRPNSVRLGIRHKKPLHSEDDRQEDENPDNKKKEDENKKEAKFELPS